MKKISKFIVIPCSLFDSIDLGIAAKWVLIAIDSIYDENPQGICIGVQAIASIANLKQKEVKDALNELIEHGALEVNLIDGATYLKPLMYKESYKKVEQAVTIGDKPKDIAATLDYAYIAQQWNEICSVLPNITIMTPRRKTKTRTTMKSCDCSTEDLVKAFRLVASSRFLTGSNNSQWTATYDWLIKSPDNLQKVLDGQYHKDYSERLDYTAIMNGGTAKKKDDKDDIYR